MKTATPPRRCCQSAAVAADRLCLRRVPHWPRPHWRAASSLHHTTPRTHGNTAISGKKRRGITPFGEPRVSTLRPWCRHDRAANRPRLCRRGPRRVGAANRPPSRRTAFVCGANGEGGVGVGRSVRRPPHWPRPLWCAASTPHHTTSPLTTPHHTTSPLTTPHHTTSSLTTPHHARTATRPSVGESGAE